MVERANAIIDEYLAAGYDLTLRQLYYQFVARDAFPEAWRDRRTGSKNTQANYKKLGGILNKGRLAGLIDWLALTDRTRHMRARAHWDDPADIVRACAGQFFVDLWEEQDSRPEVWIEKDALIGVLERPCQQLDVPYFSCRGYTGQSAMWQASQRLLGYHRSGQRPVVLHLGDHDPSGMDMTRDIQDRLDMFCGMGVVEVRRLALNIGQVREYDPPPDPTKWSDTRAAAYAAEFGEECWELDSLDPKVMEEIIREAVVGLRDEEKWQEALERVEDGRGQLGKVSDSWADLMDNWEEIETDFL